MSLKLFVTKAKYNKRKNTTEIVTITSGNVVNDFAFTETMLLAEIHNYNRGCPCDNCEVIREQKVS